MTTLKISALHYKLDWDMTEKSNRNTYIWDTIYIYIDQCLRSVINHFNKFDTIRLESHNFYMFYLSHTT